MEIRISPRRLQGDSHRGFSTDHAALINARIEIRVPIEWRRTSWRSTFNRSCCFLSVPPSSLHMDMHSRWGAGPDTGERCSPAHGHVRAHLHQAYEDPNTNVCNILINVLSSTFR